MSMGTLRALAEALDGQLVGNDCRYDAVCTDSRQLEPGALFVALRGERFDGHRFVSQAAASPTNWRTWAEVSTWIARLILGLAA